MNAFGLIGLFTHTSIEYCPLVAHVYAAAVMKRIARPTVECAGVYENETAKSLIYFRFFLFCFPDMRASHPQRNRIILSFACMIHNNRA